MRMKHIILVAAALAGSGCALGKNAAEWQVATHPAGATVRLTSSSGTMTGELLEMRDDGAVVMRADGKMVFAPYIVISRLEAPGLGSDYVMVGRMPPSRGTRAMLATVSHFPQGMTREIRDRLLAKAGQAEMVLLQ